MRLLATIGLLAGLLAVPAFAETLEGQALTPGAAVGDTIGAHRFVLSFETSAIPEAGMIKDKFQSDGIFAGVLDELAAQIALPQDIPVTFKDCGTANAFWSPNELSVTLCYELIQMYNTSYEQLDGEAHELFQWADQGSVLTGTTLFILLHELGHGFTTLFDLPITGREEDAVDQFAALTLIGADDEGDAFEQRPSRMALLGAYFFLQMSRAPENMTRNLFANEHALGQQRYYDVMCLVLGSDFDTYAPILTPGWLMVEETVQRNPEKFDSEKYMDWLRKTDELNILPSARAVQCGQEFSRYDASWDYLIDAFMTPKAL